MRRCGLRRRGFTLVELLMATLIIAVLASMALFTLAGVMEDAKKARTKAVIARIHELIMRKYESYSTRPVPIRTAGLNPQQAHQARIRAIHELMRMEMPDRITDVDDSPVFLRNPFPPNQPYQPAIWLRHRRQLNGWSSEHQPAEALYMVLSSLNDGDTNALEFFNENEIGDVDGDGRPEILDGWGNPIYWLRWAPGFESDVQGYAYDPETGQPAVRTPDPFDPLKTDERFKDTNIAGWQFDDPFQLFPLIYSAGPDGGYGIVFTDRDNSGNPVDIHYSQTDQMAYQNPTVNAMFMPTPFPPAPWPPGTRPPNDPHMILPNTGTWIGRQSDRSANDNIHNHLLDIR